MTIAALLTLQIANRPERLPTLYVPKGTTYSWTENNNATAYEEIFVEQGGNIQAATNTMRIRCRTLNNRGTITATAAGPTGGQNAGVADKRGGSGGGFIDIYAYVIINAGTISSNGGNGQDGYGGGGGGGSGGFIWIRYVTSYTNTGSVTVNGGSGGPGGYYSGYPGGGGGSFITAGSNGGGSGGGLAGPTYTRSASRIGSGGGGGASGSSGSDGSGQGGGKGATGGSSGSGGSGGLGDTLIEQVAAA